MTAALITAPALEPVSLAEAKAHLRVDGDDDDGLITASIVSARVHVEALTRRRLIAQGWRVYLDAWPRQQPVRIPLTPLISVDAVRVYDEDGNAIVVDPDDYTVDPVSVPGRLILSGAPAAVGPTVNGVEIDVTAGYGTTAAEVPAPLRQAVMMLIAHWYEHRGAVGHDLAAEIPPLGFEALIAPYRMLSL